MNLEVLLQEKKGLIDPIIERHLRVGSRDEFQRMILHPIMAGGKRIRPAMVLWACEAVGGDPSIALDAAVSVELMHTYSLIHDDIFDKDEYRRGKRTVHSIWGVNAGILVGNYLANKAFLILKDMEKNGFSSGVVLKVVDLLAWANSEMIEGQDMDVSFEGRSDVTIEEYINMAKKKTGALLRACLKIGCLLGGGSEEELHCFDKYGENVGVVFQIRDDILDLIKSEPSKGNELIGGDLRKGKKTLMVCHFLSHATEKEKRELFQILDNKDITEKEIRRIVEILEGTRSIEYAREYALRLIGKAKESLRGLPESEAKTILIELSEYMWRRKN